MTEIARTELYIVANRLPVSFESGQWQVSPGGLVAALLPIAKNLNATWLGWDGTSGAPELPASVASVRLQRIPLDAREIEGYYYGFANSVLWPLAHGRRDLVPDNFAEWWGIYVSVNEKFAHRLAALATVGATVWVHDYHLMLVPQVLRELRPDLKIGFFLHTPVGDPQEISNFFFAKSLLNGLAAADLLGLQTTADAANLQNLAGALGMADDTFKAMRVLPISINPDPYLLPEAATHRAATAYSETAVNKQQKLFLSVDRLDYAKGIIERMRAFELLLERTSTGAVHAFVLVQVLTPTRQDVVAYRELRAEVLSLTEQINCRFGDADHQPIKNIFADLDTPEVIKLYRSADALIVSSLRDGMNLVAKEFVVTRSDEAGVLILSKDAGAADELLDALIVDPRSAPLLADTMLQAAYMSPAEQSARMQKLRAQVLGNTASDWAAKFLGALG